MKKFSNGDIVTGTVTGVEDYGIFVSFDENSCGLVHISEISESFVKNVSDYASIGDSLTAKVLSVDENNHYKLSIKDLDETKKSESHLITETKSGFLNLKSNLPIWIDETFKEIEKK